jgi:hypothetical protein
MKNFNECGGRVMTSQRKQKLKQEFKRKLFFSYLFFVCWLFVYEDYKFCIFFIYRGVRREYE